jgi:hypothetical protein
MDLAALNAFGRPAVQPTTTVPASVGQRQINDPREASIPASALAARNPPDLRQTVGPRHSSSSGDTRDEHGEEGSNLRVRGRSSGGSSAAPARSRANLTEEEGDRGNSVDVTI